MRSGGRRISSSRIRDVPPDGYQSGNLPWDDSAPSSSGGAGGAISGSATGTTGMTVRAAAMPLVRFRGRACFAPRRAARFVATFRDGFRARALFFRGAALLAAFRFRAAPPFFFLRFVVAMRLPTPGGACAAIVLRTRRYRAPRSSRGSPATARYTPTIDTKLTQRPGAPPRLCVSPSFG